MRRAVGRAPHTGPLMSKAKPVIDTGTWSTAAPVEACVEAGAKGGEGATLLVKEVPADPLLTKRDAETTEGVHEPLEEPAKGLRVPESNTPVEDGGGGPGPMGRPPLEHARRAIASKAVPRHTPVKKDTGPRVASPAPQIPSTSDGQRLSSRVDKVKLGDLTRGPASAAQRRTTMPRVAGSAVAEAGQPRPVRLPGDIAAVGASKRTPLLILGPFPDRVIPFGKVLGERVAITSGRTRQRPCLPIEHPRRTSSTSVRMEPRQPTKKPPRRACVRPARPSGTEVAPPRPTLTAAAGTAAVVSDPAAVTQRARAVDPPALGPGSRPR